MQGSSEPNRVTQLRPQLWRPTRPPSPRYRTKRHQNAAPGQPTGERRSAQVPPTREITEHEEEGSRGVGDFDQVMSVTNNISRQERLGMRYG